MSELLGSIGSFFSGPAGKGIATLGELGATGAGLAGNLSADRQRAQAASLAQKNANLTPQQLAEMVKSGTQPLDRGLIQAITGNVNANLSEQGLSEAPGLIATAESQALAPFQQQNQQTALQLVLQKLGLPAEFARTIPPNANLAPLLAMLFKGSGSSGTTPTWQNQAPVGPPSSDYQLPDNTGIFGDPGSLFGGGPSAG